MRRRRRVGENRLADGALMPKDQAAEYEDEAENRGRTGKQTSASIVDIESYREGGKGLKETIKKRKQKMVQKFDC